MGNDDMAQAAHHVSEALRYALQYYRDATTRTRGGFGMGFGRGYGGGAGFNRGGMGRQGGGYKRPLDGDYGGGYSRPPSKRGARGGWAGYKDIFGTIFPGFLQTRLDF